VPNIPRVWTPSADWTPPSGWAAARWDTADQAKHMPFYGREDWFKVVAETQKFPPTSRYWAGLSPAAIEQLEMETVCGAATGGPPPGIELQRTPPGIKKRYTRDVGRLIGASNGIETNWIYVEYHTSGSVHGRPITAAEIRLKTRQ
jgi:hypothetical protein